MATPVPSATRRVGSVLIVDDYDDARAATREALEEDGHHVLEASNGQEALNILVATPEPRVELILLDLQMPVMDGWRFLKVLGGYVRLSRIPVLIVSAHAKALPQGIHQGIVGRLEAPYDMPRLLTMVSDCLASRAAH